VGLCRAAVAWTLSFTGASCGALPTLTPPADAAPPPEGGAFEVPASPSAAVAFCSAARTLEAAWRARCLGDDAAAWGAYLDSPTPCDRFDELIAAGTVAYHADRAASCLDANRADRDCATEETTCFTHVLEGTLAGGAACKDDDECPPDAGCWAASELDANACLPTTCVHVPQIGEPCGQTPYAYCFTGLTCVAGFCVAKAQEGEACGQGSPVCRPDLICYAGGCAHRIDGGPCEVDAECIPAEYCHESVCTPRIPAGGACEEPAACATFAACDASKVCVPAGHLGEPCGELPDLPDFCVEGFCSGGICQPPVPTGGDCLFGWQCRSHGCFEGACRECTN
jgi:hypothetical protein